MRFLLLALIGLAATPAHAKDAGALTLSLAPQDGDGDGVIEAIAVKIEIDSAPDGFRLATVANNVVTSADDITQLRFERRGHTLASSTSEEEPDGSNSVRRWSVAAGATSLSLSYRVALDPAREEFALPQYELRTGPYGFSGAGNAFLILPDDDLPRTVELHWDLTGLGGGVEAASSLGIGDATSLRPLRSGQLASSYFMAGSPGLYRDDGFFGAWQGELGFAGAELMRWAARLHHFYGAFFEQVPDSFGVFGRTNTLNPGSGIGLTDSFAFTFDRESEEDDLKSLLAHEMLHAWVNSLDDTMDAPNGLGSSWFGEGLAVHYQRLLPWRAGLIDNEAFLADLNETAGRYYTNALIGTPNAEIPGGFWRDTRIRVLPYDRGSLYFAKVDADILAASGGARSLDDIVRAMLAERRVGRPMNLDLWKSLLKGELSEGGLREFEAMLAGATVLPPADAFGGCLTRVQKPMRRFDLGFDPEVLVSPERIVHGLKPGSSAEAAGLRDGDRILNRFPQDAMQGDQEATLTLQLERGEERFAITYLPRGEAVPTYQWEIRAEAQDVGNCASAARSR